MANLVSNIEAGHASACAQSALGESELPSGAGGIQGTSGDIKRQATTQDHPESRGSKLHKKAAGPLERRLARSRTFRLVVIALLVRGHAAPSRTPPLFCIKHDLLSGLSVTERASLERRFWAKVEKSAGCWNWLAATTEGYGVFYLGRRDGKKVIVFAHRLAWELANGPIPSGLTIDHLDGCKCVNPAHLEPVTNIENLRRRDARREAA